MGDLREGLDSGIVYVGGVSGTGKTNICLFATSDNPNCKYFNGSDIKRPESYERFGSGMSRLNQKTSLELNRWMLGVVYDFEGGDLKVIDSHYIQPFGKSLVKIFPEERISGVDLLVLVESEAHNVLKRRIDEGNPVDSLDIKFIRKEIYVERQEAIRLSERFGVPLGVLRSDSTIEEAAKKFRHYLDF